jgi:hypothetical protein
MFAAILQGDQNRAEKALSGPLSKCALGQDNPG